MAPDLKILSSNVLVSRLKPTFIVTPLLLLRPAAIAQNWLNVFSQAFCSS
jgi:hypothetical protein